VRQVCCSAQGECRNTAVRQPGLLTVSGVIGKGNRGAFDPVLDQMMNKHGVRF